MMLSLTHEGLLPQAIEVNGNLKSMKSTVRVLLADDQSEVRSALRLLLEQANLEWTVVADAADSETLEEQLDHFAPDIVLLDWELPGLTQEKKLIWICDASRRHAIVALSGRPEARQSALEAGVDGFVSKTDTPEQLIEVLQRAIRNRTLLNTYVIDDKLDGSALA